MYLVLALLLFGSLASLAQANYITSAGSMIYPSVSVAGSPVTQYTVINAVYWNQTANMYGGAVPAFTHPSSYSPESLSVSDPTWFGLWSWFNISSASPTFGYLVPNATIKPGQSVTISYTNLDSAYPVPPYVSAPSILLGEQLYPPGNPAFYYVYWAMPPYTIKWYSSTAPVSMTGAYSNSNDGLPLLSRVSLGQGTGIDQAGVCEPQGTPIGSSTMSYSTLPNVPNYYGYTGSVTLSAPSTPTYYYGVITVSSAYYLSSLSSTQWTPGSYVTLGSDVEICSVPILISPAPPQLNTPTLTSYPSIPAAIDAGTLNSIEFTVSNIGGAGTNPPYNVWTDLASSQSASTPLASIAQSTGISGSSDTLTWVLGQFNNINASSTYYFMSEVQDPSIITSSTYSNYSNYSVASIQSFATANVSGDSQVQDAQIQGTGTNTVFSAQPNLGPLTINPPIMPSQIASFPTLPNTLTPGQSITFTDSWAGGTPPYTANLILSNSITGAVISSQLQTGIPGVMASTAHGNITTGSTQFTFTPTVQMFGNSISANVVITDSAYIPTTAAAPYYGTIFLSPIRLLIVTSGIGDSTPLSSIQAYQGVIQKAGFGSLYVKLDNPASMAIAGMSPIVSGSSWQTYKAAINNLEAQTGATYLVILGDGTIVPMPTVTPVGVMIPTDEKQDLNVSGPALIPTDDPYGTAGSGGVPDIVVARMPGSSGTEIAKMLQNAVNARTTGNTKTGIFTDISVKGYLSDLASANIFAANARLASCVAGNPNCMQSPPFCTEYLDNNLCANITDLYAAMANYGIQFYNCHGSGFVCAGATAQSPFLLVSWEIPTLSDNPVIITSACYGAEIPGTYIYNNLVKIDNITAGTKTMAVSMLDNGASVYIGSTEASLGNIGNPKINAFITIETAIDGSLYSKFVSGQTIGQAVLNEKLYYEASSQSSEGDLVDQAAETELYGDPTLTYNALG